MLRVENLVKVFRSGRSDLRIIDDLNLEIAGGEMVGIVGESGSGKSTLLQILGALDNPTGGEVYFEGVPYSRISDAEKGRMRNQNFGFVWQLHHLLPEFTALENVAMPLRIRGMSGSEAGKKAGQWLQRVGLADRTSHRTGELSGGEQQRAALARALIADPKVLMADEPTGSLDERNGELVAELVQQLHRECHVTTVLVTHNMGLAQRCDRVLRLENGRLNAVSFSQPAR